MGSNPMVGTMMSVLVPMLIALGVVTGYVVLVYFLILLFEWLDQKWLREKNSGKQ